MHNIVTNPADLSQSLGAFCARKVVTQTSPVVCLLKEPDVFTECQISNVFYFSVRDSDERLHWAVMNESSTPTLAATSKLVETHLTHVYAKLGVSGRGELATALRAMADGR